MSIQFTINGEPYSVKPEELPADITLNTFIREYAKLFGTKFYCLEGGCGCCTVTIRNRHPVTNRVTSRAVVSCLTLLNTCHDYDIVTIEGIGSRRKGYHPLQERLARFNGSQCGYCSPGMIMNMYGLLEGSNGRVTAEEVENSFGGSLCRCTGYRPILDTMKSFATTRKCELADLEQDIEDLKLCPKVGKICDHKCQLPKYLKTEDRRVWYYPVTLTDLYRILLNVHDSSYMLVAGNTSHGVYRRNPSIEIFIDVNHVQELRIWNIGNIVELGGNVTLTEMMDIFKEASTHHGFEYLGETLKHLDLLASVQIRNAGTIAGNLMIKHAHNEFVSDIFIMLLTIDARIVISNTSGDRYEASLLQFLELDMTRQVIVKIILPQWDKDNTIYGAYKILRRAQHDHAFINAGFLFTISGTRVTSSRICYGGINPHFHQSTNSVDFFNGRNLFDSETFSQALQILDMELRPDSVMPAPSPEYRKRLALGLFYKFYLRKAPSALIKNEYRSGGKLLERPLSSGQQTFDTRKDRWPVNQPVQKLEALWQCAGEAHYVNDRPHMRGEVWAAFVPATQVLSTVTQIDASEALAMPGVVAFYSAKDIPGTNTFVAIGHVGIYQNEDLFCAGVVKYHSQPVGMILAKTNDLAQLAAAKVKVWYTHPLVSHPIRPTVKDVVPNPRDYVESKNSDDEFVKVEIKDTIPEESVENTKHIRGNLELGGQFHFSIETHTTICVPHDGGLKVYPSTQYSDNVHGGISVALKIPENKIDIEVQRVGGAFGCKVSRSNHVAVACALGSWLSNRPVRFVQNIENNMRISGKRFAVISDYSVTVNNQGKILTLDLIFFEDMGCAYNETVTLFVAIPTVRNCYDHSPKWLVKGFDILTDATSHCWCRAPGTLEAIAMTENIIEHIAWTVKRDPVDVRLENIPNNDMRIMLPDFIKTIDYRARRKSIDTFNKENRWRKRGIAISLMRYPIVYGSKMGAAVVIYHYDGTVAITHGGIEMGQGLNTKAAQVAAYTFGIPLEMVTVKASNSFMGANSYSTGGSFGSETVCYAVQKACNELLDRMKPIRDKLINPTWLDLVKAAHFDNINLVSRQIHKFGDLKNYEIWGVTCTEMEVDILTGKWQISRVDIHEDTGESLNPLIDVGQVEGAYVQGLGYWLIEKLVYDRQTGELKTHNSWEYKVPGAKDIPIDFRITLVQKRPNPHGFLRSKATGEMGICMSVSAVFALRHALNSARKDAGIDEWYHLGAPTTIEDIVLTAGHTSADFRLS